MISWFKNTWKFLAFFAFHSKDIAKKKKKKKNRLVVFLNIFPESPRLTWSFNEKAYF